MSKAYPEIVYKVVPRELWSIAVAAGQFTGAAVDRVDGYIHFSAAYQVPETLARHFAGHADLLLVAASAEALGDRLRWERSRGEDLFPHLYGPLPLRAVLSVQELPLDESGKHIVFPQLRESRNRHEC